MNEQPRRVLMTTDTIGGVWSFTLDLARELGARGTEVVMAALGGPPSAAQRADAGRVANLHLLASGFKLEWMDEPWDDVEASGRWLLDLQEEYAPDIVHLNSYGHGALPWDVPVVLTAHSCVLSWWSAVKRTPLPRTWERYRHEVEYSLRSADVVTAPSRTMADSIQENYGTGARVVYNGRNHAPYRPATKEPIILAAGRVWDEAKNIAAVVRAGAQLDWPVFVAGELGRTDVADHRAPQSRFLGKLCADELARWYGRSSIYALPARYEPFGLSALEAALSGCALVLGDIPSLREVWADAALFVAPEDDNALAAGLRELIADADLRFRYAQRAAERAREYTAARMGSSYREIYQTAMQPRRTACAS